MINLNAVTPLTREQRAHLSKGLIHLYFERHRAYIIADVKALGRSAAARKWNMLPSTLSRMLARWLSFRERMLIPYMKPGHRC